jgi:hypothetical protein
VKKETEKEEADLGVVAVVVEGAVVAAAAVVLVAAELAREQTKTFGFLLLNSDALSRKERSDLLKRFFSSLSPSRRLKSLIFS